MLYLELTAEALRAMADELDGVTTSVLVVDHPEGERYLALMVRRVEHADSQPFAWEDGEGVVAPTDEDLSLLEAAAKMQGIEWP